MAAMCAVFASAAAEKPQFAIRIDPVSDFIKDQRESTAAPVLGYAGAMLEYPDSLLQKLFVTNRSETAAAMKAAGARLVKEWNSVRRWEVGMAWVNAKDDAMRAALRQRYGRKFFLGDPKEWFLFRKENGMKVFLCLEQLAALTDPVRGTESTDLADVQKAICGYLKWIRENGFADQVAGFELGNEPYWGSDPEGYGRRWCALVPAIKKIWPDAQIGMPLAEYRPNDPDIAAVRARCEDMKWCTTKGEFQFNRLNQWSGRFIVAMKPVLDDITHVVYHFYGADTVYGCSMCGFCRIASFAKVYPEVKNKKVWITEWRERSDENNRCHQMFFSALWKAHYMLTALTRAEVDGINNHCIASLAGGIYVSSGKEWLVQLDANGKQYPDVSGTGRPHIELGPSGPLFKLYTDALVGHPIVLNTGADGRQGVFSTSAGGFKFYHGGWASAQYYSGSAKRTHWVAATNPDRTSLAILCANSKDVPQTYRLELTKGRVRGQAQIRYVSCPADKLKYHAKPDEPKPWTGEERTVGIDTADPVLDLTMPPRSFMTCIVPIEGAQ
jgi:hypothetical protein